MTSISAVLIAKIGKILQLDVNLPSVTYSEFYDNIKSEAYDVKKSLKTRK